MSAHTTQEKSSPVKESNFSMEVALAGVWLCLWLEPAALVMPLLGPRCSAVALPPEMRFTACGTSRTQTSTKMHGPLARQMRAQGGFGAAR